MHLRQPVTFPKKSLLEKEGLSKTLDFLDIIDEDSPHGYLYKNSTDHSLKEVGELCTTEFQTW